MILFRKPILGVFIIALFVVNTGYWVLAWIQLKSSNENIDTVILPMAATGSSATVWTSWWKNDRTVEVVETQTNVNGMTLVATMVGSKNEAIALLHWEGSLQPLAIGASIGEWTLLQVNANTAVFKSQATKKVITLTLHT